MKQVMVEPMMRMQRTVVHGGGEVSKGRDGKEFMTCIVGFQFESRRASFVRA